MADATKESRKTRLVHMSLPLPLAGLTGTEVPSSSSADYGADSPQPRKKKSLFITITIILSGFFASAGVLMFSSIGGLLIGWITSFVTSMTGWDILVVSLFLGGVFWFIAAVLYVKHKSGGNLVKQIDSELFNKYYKYDDIDLHNISVHQLAQELQNKGCIIQEAGMNTQIICSEKMLLNEITADQKKVVSLRKFIAITVAVATMIVAVVAYIYGLFGFFGTFDWLGIIGGIGIVVFILLNADVIKIIHALFIIIVPLILFFIFGLIDPSFLWVIIGVCMGLIIVVGVIYYLKANLCKQGSWVCDFL